MQREEGVFKLYRENVWELQKNHIYVAKNVFFMCPALC